MRLSVGFAALLIAATAQFVALAQESKKPAFKLTSDEQKLLDLTNAERKKQDLPPLKPHPILFAVARSHSQNMARQEKLDHDLDDKSPFDRIREAKYEYQRAAENVAMSGGSPKMAEILGLWMESTGHRANILSRAYTEIGLGIARNSKGELYCTQVFALRFEK